MRLQLGAGPCMQCSNAPRRVKFQIPGTLYFFQAYSDFVVSQSRIRITKPADMLPRPLKPLSNGAAAVELSHAATFDAHASEGAREQRWLRRRGGFRQMGSLRRLHTLAGPRAEDEEERGEGGRASHRGRSGPLRTSMSSDSSASAASQDEHVADQRTLRGRSSDTQALSLAP